MNYGLGSLGTAGNGLSLMRILGSLSKTVGIVRQFAPIYRDIKPILQKAPIFFQRINSMRNTNLSTPIIDNTLPTIIETAPLKTELTSSTGPSFFQ